MPVVARDDGCYFCHKPHVFHINFTEELVHGNKDCFHRRHRQQLSIPDQRLARRNLRCHRLVPPVKSAWALRY